MNINNNIEIYQGDCFETIKTISDKSIDLVLTDPPYEHIKGGMKSKFNTGIMSNDSVINTKLNDFEIWTKDGWYWKFNVYLKQKEKNNE